MRTTLYLQYILKVLDLTRKTQTRLHAEIAHASNKRNGAFICVRVRLRLHSFAFAFVCEYCSRSTGCANVRAHALTYVYIYTQLGPGLVPDPAVPQRRAGSSPIASSVPAPIGVPPARLRHQPGCARLACRPTGRDQLDPPLRESSRQINELRVVRPVRLRELCARIQIYDRACICARIYMYMRMLLYPREFAFVYMHKLKHSFLRAFACVRVFARS